MYVLPQRLAGGLVAAGDRYMGLYSDCLDESGPMDNSAVFGCARQIENQALEQIGQLLLDLKKLCTMITNETF